MKPRLRTLWLKTHLYLGLTAGLIFSVLGLTGSVLVFHRNLDEWANAPLMRTRHQGERISLANAIAAAEASPSAPGRANSIFLPRTSNNTYEVRFKKGGEGESQTTEIFVDPITAEVLGQRVRGSGLIATIYAIHAKLLLGKTGETILGVTAVLAMISILSGLILWWPLLRAGFKFAFGIRRRNLNFEIHKSLGAIFAPIMLLIAFTGLYLAAPGWIKPLVTKFSPETKLPQKVKSVVTAEKRTSLTPDEAVAVASSAMPGSRLMSVELPARPDDAYRVFVRQVGEVGELRGVGRVWVDRYSGEVLATRDWNSFTLADTYFRIQLALHSGDAFGLIFRWLFCLSGLVPTVLYVTGIRIWWRKRQARRRQMAGLRSRAAELDNTPLGNEANATEDLAV